MIGQTRCQTARIAARLITSTYRLMNTSISTSAGLSTRLAKKTKPTGTVSEEKP